MGVRVNSPGAELEEVADHGGAARASLEPNEEWGFGERGNGFLSFIKGVENGGTRSRIHRKVAGSGGDGFVWEERGGSGEDTMKESEQKMELEEEPKASCCC